MYIYIYKDYFRVKMYFDKFPKSTAVIITQCFRVAKSFQYRISYKYYHLKYNLHDYNVIFRTTIFIISFKHEKSIQTITFK